MTTRISTFFNDSETGPITGLTPTVRVREAATGTLVVTDSNMTEIGDGFYTMTFSEDPALDYTFRADAKLIEFNQFAFGATGVDGVNSLQAQQIEDTLDFFIGRFETNSETGEMTLFNSVNSPLYVSSIYIDVTATLPYDGTAINRRDRAVRLF